ncbi:MAG: hypothetical protein RLN62_01050, partial [Rickettsiales bacterium]
MSEEINQTQTIAVQADGSFKPLVEAPVQTASIPTDPAKVEAAKEIFARYAYHVDALKYEQADLLFPETADLFLTKVILCSINDQQKDQQLELAKSAIDMGADINKVFEDKSGYFRFDSIYNLQSVLLIPETANKFFSKLLSAGIRDKDKPKQLEL